LGVSMAELVSRACGTKFKVHSTAALTSIFSL
jgi:hypothetical protein